MTKTILLTGATDGIGFETAKILAAQGHTLLIHGRSEDKLAKVVEALAGSTGVIETYRADLGNLSEVKALASAVTEKHKTLDVLINNAGVFNTSNPQTADGYDVRFIVNAIAPYILTKELVPLLTKTSRVVNLSSAAQAPVNLQALTAMAALSANDAYAQSKLAITMWSFHMSAAMPDGPMIVAVNPASFLGSKMVKEAYGTEGKDLGIGADILVRAALSDEFANASGRYFDNDSGQFSQPHPDALDMEKNRKLVEAIETLLDTESQA